MKSLKKIYYFLGSLKFAVIVILSIAVISATGTFVESRYNAEIAQLWVYKTIYMKIVLSAFAVSIAISAFTRWPWKRKHIPFLTAHLGLLTLVYGAWITQTFGIDGSISIPVGQKSQWVSSVEKELELYATYDGQNYTSLYRKEIEFLLHDPKKHPIQIPTEEWPFKNW
jgi:cytochrome c biogenesis factor